MCQDAETREVLARVEKQVAVLRISLQLCITIFLHFCRYFFIVIYISVFSQVAVLSQSTGRVASSSEQYGAVQQEARVATAIEVISCSKFRIKTVF